MKCKFCGGSDFINLNNVVALNYVNSTLPIKAVPVSIKVDVCTSCGLGVNHTPLSREEYNQIYNNFFYFAYYFDDVFKKYFYIDDISFFVKHIPNIDSKVVELGCHDGHLLYMIQEYQKQHGNGNFTNLMGIEPSPNADIGIAHGLHIEKAYFKPDYFKDNEKVDVFISRCFFEHLEEPFEMFKAMLDSLSDNGKIIMKVPNFTGYELTHLYYYSWPFLEKMAARYNAKIIDCLIKYQEIWNAEEITVVISHKDAEYPEIKCPFDIEYTVKHEKQHILEDKKLFSMDCIEMEKFMRDKENVYFLGTSIHAPYYLTVLNKMKVKTNIIPVDILQNRKGYELPYCNNPVILLSDLKGKNIDAMVINGHNKEDIFAKLNTYNINVENIFYTKFLI